MGRNYGIRYIDDQPDDEEFNPENNYSAWIPHGTIDELFSGHVRGLGTRQLIPKDYVPVATP